MATPENTTRQWIALGILAILTGLALWWIIRANRQARTRRESVAAYREAASALIDNRSPVERDARNVLALRAAALSWIPETTADEFEAAYSGAVADSVADQEVTPDEMRRLGLMAKGLSLPVDVVKRANLNGFLQGFSALVADHKLTTDEEGKLTRLREVFKVPDSAIQTQLAKVDQLRRARQVSESPLVAIDTTAKVRKGEESYHTTEVREMKERVARTWVEDGERRTERQLQDVRSGTLYVTNQRLLLVANGTTNIKLDSILSLSVDLQTYGDGVLSLIVDGRKSPYYFVFPEPYVTLAFIEKVMSRV
jgi:hypothetical protein